MRYVIAAAALGLSFPAQAATTVYTETFDQYAASQVPWNGSGVWTTNSVDLVRSGEFFLTCVGGSGNCVDLSGSAPGSLSRVINLAAGLYSLTFQFTGNQLNGNPPGATYNPTSFDVTFNGITSTVGPLANNSSVFQTFNSTYNVLSGGAVTLSFAQNQGGDPFRGSIIDSIVISAVPEPTAWALMILGFGIVGGALRRQRKVKARISLT